jgi:hypothetical protein
MTGEQLHISERTASLVNEPCSPRDESSSSAMARTSLKAECAVGQGEKIADRDWGHRPAALGPDDRTHGDRNVAPAAKGVTQIGVHGNQPPALFLRCVVPKLDDRANIE